MSLQLSRSASSSVQASVHDAVSEDYGEEVQQWLTQVFQNKNPSDKDEEELQQWVWQTFQDAGSSLEETNPDHLLPIVKYLMEHDCDKAAVMVINAMLVSMPNDVYLLKSRSRLEAEYDLPQALRTLSELINLGVADASDYLLYGQLLLSVENDQQAAGDVVRHAVAICEPSNRFDMLVNCANMKGVIGDLEGALEYFVEADSLGQLNFNDLKRLGELQVTVGDVAAALDPLNRAAAMEPSNAHVRQQQGACKLFAGDHGGAVADLDAAILQGERSTLTYRCRGIANLRLAQLDTALADLNLIKVCKQLQKSQTSNTFARLWCGGQR